MAIELTSFKLCKDLNLYRFWRSSWLIRLQNMSTECEDNEQSKTRQVSPAFCMQNDFILDLDEEDSFDFGLDDNPPSFHSNAEKPPDFSPTDSNHTFSHDTPGNPNSTYSNFISCEDFHSERQSVANERLADLTSSCKNASLWLLVATAAMTYTLHGFSNSVTNGILTLDTFLAQFPQTDTIHTAGPLKSHNATMQGIMVGIYQVGCALGSMTCFFLTDRVGRKRVIHGLGVLNTIGVILQATSFSLGQLFAGRFVMGLGVGAGHATFPLFLAECVTSNVRGRAIIACAAAGNFGHFSGAAVELAFYALQKSSAQWRAPIACEFIWACASVILPFWCVETPRFLLRKGRYTEAINSQAKLSGLAPTDPLLLERIKVLEDALHESSADEIVDARLPPKRWYRAILAVFIQIMSSMSGIDVISFFSTQTFQSQLHFSALVSRYLTLGLQACQWLWSSISIFLIDTLGRRPLILGTAFVMSLSMGCLTGLTSPTATVSMLKSAILFFFLVMCAYPVGYHLIPSMYAAELSPGATRHQITAVSGCLHFLFDFTVTLITPVAVTSIHARYYFVYMATNACTLVVVYLLFPETKGLELEQIDEIFENSASYFSIVKHGRHGGGLKKFGNKVSKGELKMLS